MKKLIIASGALLLLTGCGALSEDSRAGEPASPQPMVEDIKPAASPDPQAVDKVQTIFALSPTTRQALGKTTAQCMADRGFPNTNPEVPETQEIHFLSKPLTVEQAREHGYERLDSSATAEHEEQDQDGKLTQEEVEKKHVAFMGSGKEGAVQGPGGGSINKDGCVARSYEAVFGSAETGAIFMGADNLSLPYMNAAMQDGRVSDVSRRWSECMKDQYHLVAESPERVVVDIPNADKNVAISDAQCRVKVDYDATVRNTTNAYLTTFLKDKQEILDKVATAKKAAEENAPKILGR